MTRDPRSPTFSTKQFIAMTKTAKEPRDPRTEPQKGDVLATPVSERAVRGVDAHGVRYRTMFQGMPAFGRISLEQWQTWARDAQIIKHAKEQNDVDA